MEVIQTIKITKMTILKLYYNYKMDQKWTKKIT